ncbi:PKD domain-containing protein [Haloarchaeobius sp. HME9146]|uniref:PKD domain-containing protein n=1 Tax=Haloarchaeobius sp. HME9146 TaxID=2978732 RepID=UPI0021C0E5E8|nr:PKD domain-containing protein [Haloarchaeobius sp. HME9146]MCT9096801.1 PKD domain-containing protein [Haloarchaeobius sp. HME9146]
MRALHTATVATLTTMVLFATMTLAVAPTVAATGPTSTATTPSVASDPAPGTLALQENTSPENESSGAEVTIYGPDKAVYDYTENFSIAVAGADVESVTWQFPDGSTATGTEASYRFMQEGNRTVTVVVETTDGETLNESATYTVLRFDDESAWNPVPALKFFGAVGFFVLLIVGLKVVALPLLMQEL